jgi:outer membrane biosynthesis protein TonB
LLGTIVPEVKKPVKTEENKIKISLKEMPKLKKHSEDIKEEIEPTTIAPPMPKGSQLKKIVKPPVKYEPAEPVKKPKLNPKPKETKSEPEPKPKIEPLPQKPYITLAPKKDVNTTKPEPKEEPEKSVNPLYAILSQDKSSQEKDKEEKKTYSGSSINQNIKELYGDEFGKLSPGQQKYILDNQEIMRRITQQVLTRVARVNLPRDLNVNKTNVIEFYLHPNGDMSDFRFLKKSGYYVLDDTTKETIEYAYSRYPRPTEKTLVRYNVFYNLARY